MVSDNIAEGASESTFRELSVELELIVSPHGKERGWAAWRGRESGVDKRAGRAVDDRSSIVFQDRIYIYKPRSQALVNIRGRGHKSEQGQKIKRDKQRRGQPKRGRTRRGTQPAVPPTNIKSRTTTRQ